MTFELTRRIASLSRWKIHTRVRCQVVLYERSLGNDLIVVKGGLEGVTYVPYGWSQAPHCTLRSCLTRSVSNQKRSLANGYEFGLISTAATQQ